MPQAVKYVASEIGHLKLGLFQFMQNCMSCQSTLLYGGIWSPAVRVHGSLSIKCCAHGMAGDSH
jgi:hypothetical protein